MAILIETYINIDFSAHLRTRRGNLNNKFHLVKPLVFKLRILIAENHFM